MDTFVGILGLLTILILSWETMLKPWLSNRVRRRRERILKENPETQKNIPHIDQTLRIDDFKGKYMLHINKKTAPILFCDDREIAKEISSLWHKYIGKMNDEITFLELEKKIFYEFEPLLASIHELNRQTQNITNYMRMLQSKL